MDIAELDALPVAEAREALRACCGASRWVEAMVARRPFREREQLLAAASSIWQELGPADWKAAFAHHPRIGERTGAVHQTARGDAWSGGEQAGVVTAAESARQALREVNREYEAKFGYIYIICAQGLSPEELLAQARRRLGNDAETELHVAAQEQLKITLLRLDKLIADSF